MRKKVTDYLSKPNTKLYAELTTMERKYVDAQSNAADGPAAPKAAKKP